METLLLCQKLSSTKFIFSNEIELHQGIEQFLISLGIDYQKEVILDSKDRIDFLIGKIGIEIKINESTSEVTRQLWRYAQQEMIDEIILITTRSKHKVIEGIINGKPIYIVHLLTFL